MMILVVDDQENMCWILSKVLSKVGFCVKTAHTVKAALSIADTDEISGAVLDFRLPDGNGLDLFLELRQRHQNLPCVLITSYGSQKLHAEASELGFVACFDKPFDNRALIAVLEKAVKSGD